MQITVNLPNDLAAPLLTLGQEPARAVLEALEAHRARLVDFEVVLVTFCLRIRNHP